MNKGVENDALLISRIKKDDQEAFYQIYLKYHRLVYSVAIKFLKSHELSQDLVQEVFIKIWDHRLQLDTNLSLKAYIHRVSQNMIFNILKKAAVDNKVRHLILKDYQQESYELEEVSTQSIQERLALEAIDLLPPGRKTVFKMCKLEGKSYDQVAADLGISKGTVKDHMVKAIKTLRSAMASPDFYIPAVALLFLYLKK